MNRARRSFIEALGGWGALCAVSAGPLRLAHAQTPIPPLTTASLRGGLELVSGAGSNVVMLTTGDGLALVDSGSQARAPGVKSLIAERFDGAPLELLFNTHWHVEHTGGNDVLRDDGTRIIAHENTRLWMSTKIYVDWEDRRYTPRAAAALPNETFYSSDPQPIEVSLGNERIVYGHLKGAHTDGDIYVWFPGQNVIAAGGAATSGRYPVPDYITGGWIGGTADATSAMIEMADADTLIVPADGPVLRRSDLVAQHEMLTTVRERIEAMAIVGKGFDEMIDARITEDFDARFGNDADLFIANVYRGLWWGNRIRGTVA